MTKPHLSQRAIVAYNRLSLEVAALNYLTRIAKPAGTLGLEGRIALDRTLKLAFRLYRREPGLPFSGRIDTSAPLTNADLVLLVARLTTCCTAFEERYAHLKEDGGGVSLSSKAMSIGST
ncbi:hypothetical protein SAMN05428969_1615 [Devosia sp. YR412]|uniref:hypothetical protein n=1 Tax=Devosia sp. YR412 TaxID=1881030 RepID=UPI0008AE04E5|nr:hypothetical protein [Devosia sp. YR412]SEQ02969.1 hypothetical protein SAMN05428969_1615 [Devosia sp. YR412]